MGQEETNLLFKDLCERLPFGVMCKIKGEGGLEPVRLKSYMNCDPIFAFDFYFENESTLAFRELEEIQPYLFPISGMTEKQKAELAQLVKDEENIFKCFLIELEYYRKNHLDYNDLIPWGLALDATGLNIYKEDVH